MIDLLKKDTLYSFSDSTLFSQSAYLTNDGTSIGVIDDWSEQYESDSLIVLKFYVILIEFIFRGEVFCLSFTIKRHTALLYRIYFLYLWIDIYCACVYRVVKLNILPVSMFFK